MNKTPINQDAKLYQNNEKYINMNQQWFIRSNSYVERYEQNHVYCNLIIDADLTQNEDATIDNTLFSNQMNEQFDVQYTQIQQHNNFISSVLNQNQNIIRNNTVTQSLQNNTFYQYINNIINNISTQQNQTYTIQSYENQQSICQDYYQNAINIDIPTFLNSSIKFKQQQQQQQYKMHDATEQNNSTDIYETWKYVINWLNCQQEHVDLSYSYSFNINNDSFQQKQNSCTELILDQYFCANYQDALNDNQQQQQQKLNKCLYEYDFTLNQQQQQINYFKRPSFYGKGRKQIKLSQQNQGQNQSQFFTINQIEDILISKIDSCLKQKSQSYENTQWNNYWLQRQVSKLRIHDYQNQTRINVSNFSLSREIQEFRQNAVHK